MIRISRGASTSARTQGGKTNSKDDRVTEKDCVESEKRHKSHQGGPFKNLEPDGEPLLGFEKRGDMISYLKKKKQKKKL